MGGPDGGLALAILIAMAAMVALPALVLAGVGLLVGRWRAGEGRRGRGGLLGALGGLALGAAGGVLAIWLTFFQDGYDDLPTLVLDAPADREAVYVLEDPAVSTEIRWDGDVGRLAVPASGVVRVRSLGPLATSAAQVQTTDGRVAVGSASTPGPAELGVAQTRCFDFVPFDPAREDPCGAADAQLAARIRALEGR
ncbi:MAG: hypothetical protein VYE22_27280 [Myxococcota bacterium]|nr:hypothetical protein [Myxococcota bacterium]